MIRIYEGKDGTWRLDIRVRGADGAKARRRLKSPVPSRSGSLRWGQDQERQILEELARPTPAPKPQIPTLAGFAPRFYEYCEANRQKPSGVAAKRTILKVHLLPILGGRPIDEIGEAEAELVKREMQWHSAKTVNNALSTLHKLLTVAARLKQIPAPPCLMPLLPYEAPEMDFWDFDELLKLLEAARKTGTAEHLVVLLGAHAGLRCGEIMALAWGDVDLNRRVITVRSSEWKGHLTETKSRRIRRVEMTDSVHQALRAHRHLHSERVLSKRSGGPLTQKVVRTIVERTERLAGLPAKGVHALRHTFCSHLAMRGVPAPVIQRLAGHRSLSTTMRYVHLAPGSTAGAIRKLDDPAPRGNFEAPGRESNAN